MKGLVIFSRGNSIGCQTANCRFYATTEDAADFYEKLHKGRNAQLYNMAATGFTAWVLIKERKGY